MDTGADLPERMIFEVFEAELRGFEGAKRIDDGGEDASYFDKICAKSLRM